jgi:hypothetical protein
VMGWSQRQVEGVWQGAGASKTKTSYEKVDAVLASIHISAAQGNCNSDGVLGSGRGYVASRHYASGKEWLGRYMKWPVLMEE